MKKGAFWLCVLNSFEMRNIKESETKAIITLKSFAFATLKLLCNMAEDRAFCISGVKNFSAKKPIVKMPTPIPKRTAPNALNMPLS